MFLFTGAYRPDIHRQYGSNTALKMGQESDLESIVSSDVSMLAPDNLALRLVPPYCLVLSMLGTKSADGNLKYFSEKIGFDISCKLSPVKAYYLEKKK